MVPFRSPKPLDMTWSDEESTITLKANLESMDFSISHSPAEGETQVYTYPLNPDVRSA